MVSPSTQWLSLYRRGTVDDSAKRKASRGTVGGEGRCSGLVELVVQERTGLTDAHRPQRAQCWHTDSRSSGIPLAKAPVQQSLEGGGVAEGGCGHLGQPQDNQTTAGETEDANSWIKLPSLKGEWGGGSSG